MYRNGIMKFISCGISYGIYRIYYGIYGIYGIYEIYNSEIFMGSLCSQLLAHCKEWRQSNVDLKPFYHKHKHKHC